jgi:hypothetical protein
MSNNYQEKEKPDEQMIQEAMNKGYRRGWEERKEYDSGLIEDAIRKSNDFEEFSRILREAIARADGPEE